MVKRQNINEVEVWFLNKYFIQGHTLFSMQVNMVLQLKIIRILLF